MEEPLFVIQENRTYVKLENMYEAMLISRNFPDRDRRMARKGKAELKWIGKLFERNIQRAKQLVTKLLFGISTHDMPVCIMTISAFVYYSKKHGLDAGPLIAAIEANKDWIAENHGDNMYNYLNR